MRVRVVIPKKKPAQVEDAQCQECHRKIVPDAITCPHCHAPIVRKYCPKCSQLIPEETTSCPLCGAAGNSRPKMDPQN